MDPAGSAASGLTIGRARLTDVPDLLRIEAACFDGDRLSVRAFRRHCVSQAADLFLARALGEAMGYALVFHRAGAGVGRLYSIAARPEARGRGVASALLETCERASRRRGMRAIRLEVREDNAAAISLYTRRGYVAFGRHDAYYEDGAPALRMEKALSRAGRMQ